MVRLLLPPFSLPDPILSVGVRFDEGRCRAAAPWSNCGCAGRSIGDAAGSAVWFVTGAIGENVIQAEGKTQAEAGCRATLQAQAVGMLAPRKGNTDRARF